MKRYCEICGKEENTKVITKNEHYMINNEDIEVTANVLVCETCGEEMFCEELDNKTLVDAYNIYRKKHKLLTAEEIKLIREQYGLSQRAFSKLLNWGDKTINRYENGAIQDKAHNSMLLFLKDPDNMRSYLAQNEICIDDKQRKKIETVIQESQQEKNSQKRKNLLDSIMKDAPSEWNGYKKFDYEKLCAMVSFFAWKSGELLKTKLFKLLNYSDMIFYIKNGISISGMQYVHMPYGPVPSNFDILMHTLEMDKIIQIEYIFDGEYEKHKIISDYNKFGGVLSDQEIEIMNSVFDKFQKYGSVEISKYSHNEEGYKSTEQGQLISYKYAKNIAWG